MCVLYTVAMQKTKKTIVYLRADIGAETLSAGGSVAHTLGVIKGLHNLGYSVVCASSAMLGLLSSMHVAELVRLANPRCLSFMRWKLNCLLSNIFFTLQILSLFRRHDISLIYQRYTMLNCVGVILRKLKGIPLILEYNSSEVWKEQHWSRKSWFSLHWLIGAVERLNLKHADCIVAVSQVLYDELIARGIPAAKILLNPNGVDAHELDPAVLEDERARLRAHLKCADDAFVFGFVGTFSPWHGIERMAQMVPVVLQRDARARFLFVGDGPLKAWLQTTLMNASCDMTRVIFTGIIPQNEAKHYLAACDAFLLPSQPNADGSPFFGSPIKLFEYMSMAKPIIASDIEQVAQVLHPAWSMQGPVDDAVGILVPPHDARGFVDATCAIMQSPAAERAALGTNARVRVLERHTWDAHVRAIMQFVERPTIPVTDHRYSDGITNTTIAIIGPKVPPPYGGIRVHVERVAAKFSAQGNRVHQWDAMVEWRYRYFPWYAARLAYFLVCRRPQLVYYHTLHVSNSIYEVRVLVLLKKIVGYRLITVEHNCRHLHTRNARYKKLFKRCVPYIDKQVLIGTSTYQSYCNTAMSNATSVTVERAFLPPGNEQMQRYPDEVMQFLHRHTPIITVSVTRLVLLNGKDLYGCDMAIEVMRHLVQKFPQAGLVCMLGDINEIAYYAQLRERISVYGLQQSIYFLQGSYTLWPMLQQSDLLLRPTLSDGASVSEDEAHWVGIPVVASNVCERHRTTHVYRSGDVDDCVAKIISVLGWTYAAHSKQRDIVHAQQTR